MFRNTFMYSVVASSGLLCSNALADIPGGDVHLTMQGGQLVTGRISEDGLTITPNVRVFFTDLGLDVPNTADDPGLRADVGAFAPGTSISLSINRALRVWNGTDFSTIAPITMTTTFGPVSVTSPLTDVFTPGFSIPVDPDGSFHHHPDRALNDPASDGIYLLDLTIGASGLTSAPRIWTLYNQNMDDATAQAAYDYALANVPAPGGALCLGVGALLLRRRPA
jgi:hypothetical protein